MKDASAVEMPAGATRAERLALGVLQFGALAVVLAATTLRAFDLDRFLVPKELVLHFTVAAAGLLTIGAIRRVSPTRVDRLLLVYLLLGALSAAMATNRWLGMRALAISVSGAAVFWVARALRQAGLGRPLLNVLAFAIVLAAATALAQAYGLRLDLFSVNRAPGGTLGNRNFVAHAAAFGLPVTLLAALGARSTRGWFTASLGVMMTTAALVLTRSRAAWLSCGAVVIVTVAALLVSPPLRRDGRTWRRFAGAALLTACGVAAVLLIPNTLHWRSDNPYLESMKGMANFEEGSGRGRLIQYGRSLLLAVRHPLLGTGPGNWPVDYPGHAPPGDPSMNPSDPGTTFNPWPSSDWVAFVAERGFAAAALFAFVFFTIATGSLRQLAGAGDLEQGLTGTAALGTIVAAGVAGAFDAVLLLPLPTLLVWAALGALWTPAVTVGSSKSRWPAPLILFLMVAASATGAARSTAQLMAMKLYVNRGDRASLQRAARIDPGNFRVHLRLAAGGGRMQRCAHARAAHALFPSSQAARGLSRGCGDQGTTAGHPLRLPRQSGACSAILVERNLRHGGPARLTIPL